MASAQSRQKSKNLTPRRRLARKLKRDRRIYRNLRQRWAVSLMLHNNYREKREPLSVYGGKLGRQFGAHISRFPVTKQENGRPMPKWEDLSAWLKSQVLVMCLHEWGLQTFTIHLHSDLEAKWLAAGKNPRVEIRNRLKREMDKAIGPRGEYFFIVEGWSKKDKKEVKLHIHGGGFIREDGDGPKIVEAASRACGQGVRGKPREARSVHEKVYWKEGQRYVDYIFKSVRRKDQRLGRRRLHMSREAVGAGREMWKLMTEPR